jgi:hypothetical protein
VSPLLTARLKRDSSEKRLYRIMQRLEETEKTLADHHAARAIHEATEVEVWDAHSDFRLQAKEAAAAGNMEEKKRLDMELRAIQSTVRGATDAVDACNATIETTVKTIASQRRQVDALQSEIGAMSEKIEELVIESSFVRPKMCLDLLPRNHTSMDGIKIDSPYPSCNRFFSDRACAPMSCGCLYHPHCMLKVVFAVGAQCPKCNLTCTGTWMAQWGHPLDSNMEAHIEATRTALATLGWQPGRPSANQVLPGNQLNPLTVV